MVFSLKDISEVYYISEQKIGIASNRTRVGLMNIILKFTGSSLPKTYNGNFDAVRFTLLNRNIRFCKYCRSRDHKRAQCPEAPKCTHCRETSHKSTNCRNRDQSHSERRTIANTHRANQTTRKQRAISTRDKSVDSKLSESQKHLSLYQHS